MKTIIAISAFFVLAFGGIALAAVSRLPSGITKFQDGNVTCYVLKEIQFVSEGFTKYVTYSGISCIETAPKPNKVN